MSAAPLRLVWVFAALLACSLLLARSADAREAGIASSVFLSRNPPSCNSCHSGGAAPAVTLTADDTTLSAGQQILLTLTVTTPNGSPGAAGFNLRSSQQGTFAVGGSASANTRTLSGTNGWLEATHTAPKAGEPVTFTVLYTPGAAATGTITFTAWGNAVNANGSSAGDQAASASLNVTVTTCTPVTWYRDADGDGYGASASGTTSACAAPSGYVSSNNDCNDTAAAIHPGATEVCNGLDDDCAGGIDNGLASSTYYRDADGDGHGAAASGTRSACSAAVAGAGYVTSNDDCDDSDENVFPGAPEICDNDADDNCNDVVDTDAAGGSTFYRDADGDGFGSTENGTTVACSPPSGYVSTQNDCDDGDGDVHPGATEVCNGVDDDCAGGADDGFGTLQCGTGACARTVDECDGGVPGVCTPGPVSDEECNGLDDDCDDEVDEEGVCDGGGGGAGGDPEPPGGAAGDGGGDAGSGGEDPTGSGGSATNGGSGTTTGGAGSSTGGTGNSGGASPSGGSSGGGSDEAPGDGNSGTDGDSGCGCRFGNAPSDRLASLALLVVIALLRRRRVTKPSC